MAAILEKPAPAEKFASEVEEQLAQATQRIRSHDLAFGGLVLAAMLLVYATAMILVDKYAVLPEWVRQAGLLGFIVAAGAVAYGTIVRPLRRRVNPLYAAVQVEKTIDDSKNSVAGYVSVQEKGEVHPAVKAAMGARAARSVGEADINRAVDHRSLIYAGAVAVVFFLVLIALFFVFRPAQFRSLASRAFVPFTADPIASRTQLTLLEPETGDAAITVGQSITVKVNVGGKVPSATSPERVRIQIRHNPAAPDFEELPLSQGDTSREWQIRVPDYLVRNGFWYRVVGGDAETPEYRVTVRSLPLFTEYEVTYDYPAYTRLKPETTHEPFIRGIRGTKVAIVGKTNRTVKDGKLTFDPPLRDPLKGTVPEDKPDSIRFQFTLTESGLYRMTFTSKEGERSPEPPPSKITVDEDQPPSITIVKPEEKEITLPANGQLAVDAAIADDIGIDKAAMKLRIVEPAPRDLAGRPFQNGKSFRRAEKDGMVSWPTNLDYKDSIDLAKLTDAAGVPVELKEGMVLEYWLEAADNRTKPGANGPEPDPNLGKSEVRRVRIAAPIMAKDEQQNLNQEKKQREKEEQANNQMQQKRLDAEKREPNQPNQPNQPQPPQSPMGAEPPMPPENPMGDPPPMMPPMAKNGMEPMTKNGMEPMPKNGMEPMGNPPMMPPNKNGMEPMNPETAPPPSEKQPDQTKQEAERIQEQINKNKEGGSAKSGPSNPGERANPSEPKPKPMNGEMSDPPPEANPKQERQPNPGNPMSGSNDRSETKPMGKRPQPEEPASTKPENAPMNPMSDKPPSETKPAPKSGDPMEGASGMDKMPPKGQPEEKPSGMAKPASQQKPDEKNPGQGAAQPKPMPNSDPGREKPEPKPQPQPMTGGAQESNGQPGSEQESGSAKPQSGPPPAGAKASPKNANPMNGEESSEPKPGTPEMGATGSTKPAGKPPMDGLSGDKSAPDQNPQQGTGSNPKNAKPTPEQQKELENAVKDLGSDDPAKQKAAQDKLDKMVGEKNRKEIEKKSQEFKNDVKDLAGNDPAKQKAAQDKLDKSIGEKNRKDIEKGIKDFEKSVQDLNSKDDKTRQEAQRNLDKTVGEENRKKIEEIQNGMNSNDPKEKAAAQDKLKNLQAQAGAQGKEPKPEQPKGGIGAENPKLDPKELADAMKDLGSPDKAKRDAAKEKLDKALGQGAGDKAEQLQNDLKSDDAKKRAAAQKEIDDLKKQAREFAKNNPPEKENGPGGAKADPMKVEQALDDLNSDDAAKRQQAKKDLDDMLGKGAGDKAEQFNKMAQSDDPNKQAEGRKGRDDLLKQADQMAKKGQQQTKGPPPSKEQIEQLAKKMSDLQSQDEGKRKAAEQDLDKQIGEPARRALQEAMKDPKKAADLKQKMQDLGHGGGDPTAPLLEAMKEDARNRAKSAELQLEQFEKNKTNDKLLKDLGMTPEEYARFLDDFKKETAKLKKSADDLDKLENMTLKGPALENVSQGGKRDSRNGASVGAAAGPSVAAPGYADALKAFQERAQKAQPKK